jgi:hypothetical protein
MLRSIDFFIQTDTVKTGYNLSVQGTLACGLNQSMYRLGCAGNSNRTSVKPAIPGAWRTWKLTMPIDFQSLAKDLKRMLKLFAAIGVLLMFCSCSGGSVHDQAITREINRTFYRFQVTRNDATSSNVYYVWPENQTWGNYTVFRVIEPIVDIDSYSEHIIEGSGPDGGGRYRMRIVENQELIESYTSIYFLVSGF